LPLDIDLTSISLPAFCKSASAGRRRASTGLWLHDFFTRYFPRSVSLSPLARYGSTAASDELSQAGSLFDYITLSADREQMARDVASVTMSTITRLPSWPPQRDEREEVPWALWILTSFTRSSRSFG
jgi:hypothetical protein